MLQGGIVQLQLWLHMQLWWQVHLCTRHMQVLKLPEPTVEAPLKLSNVGDGAWSWSSHRLCTWFQKKRLK